MKWVIGWTVCIYVIANLPLLFLSVSPASRSALSTLWGYSPHQFLFCTIIFPFACFSSLTSLYLVVARIGMEWPEGLRGYVLLQNWPALLLAGLCLSSVITLADYISSARSLDKLAPSVSKAATQSFQRIQDAIANVPRAQKQDVIDDLSQKAERAKRDIRPPHFKDSEEAAGWLQGLPPELVLQIVGDASLQRQLRLLDPTIYPLSILQVLVSIFVGVIALFCAGICLLLLHNGQTSAAVWAARNAVFNAVFFFGFYSICYQQYRNEMETYGIRASTTLQQVIVGLIVAVLLVALAVLDASKEHMGPEFLTRFGLPVLVLVLGVGAEFRQTQLLRQLIGAGSNLGTQIILSIVIVVIGSFIAFLIWPQVSPPLIKP